MSAPEKNYKDTILLPNTTFPMRGDLTLNEPKRLEKWEKAGLYSDIIKRRQEQNAPTFILHDGPPFANGDVHMGTALNKILKDMVIKSKTMAGYLAPYIPGWDCHGLPIEFKVVQKARDLDPAEIRRRCTEFAKEFIDIQRNSFRRLGVFGDWDHPYLTMDPAYEATILRVFAKLVDMGAVYQSRKPVQWSYGAYTALAEAEVEYKEITSTSIFVAFPILGGKFGLKNASIVIWTTTPWTLPSNVAIALHPRFTYVAGKFIKEDKVQTLILLKEAIETFTLKTGWALAETICEFKGAELEGEEASHPFLPRTSKIVMAEFVTTDTGTGAVHIAPGHGTDDYIVGRQNGLPVLSPVDDDGKYTDEVGIPSLVGKHVFSVEDDIITMLNGHMLGKESYSHQYPHCWRSKTPIIFRAVEQFFISMDKLKPTALEEIDKVQWLPAWGRNRIYGTVEARPDWCISRQRTWGIPLPVFFDENGQAHLSGEIVRRVADLVEEKGSNIWFELSDEELCSRLGLGTGLRKGRDTLDVWIDSGCSHVAVLEGRPELHAPCDLYLEATDQHRGWFQSSLMLSVAWRGTAPYKTVMTHAFVVDKDTGKKTSKSDAKTSGKPTDAKYFYDKYGADIVRLWASSVDWQNEVPFGEDLFKQVTEPYRRLRNTLRILLGNISDFDPATDAVDPGQMPILDRWIMERLNSVIEESRKAYEAFEFRKVFNTVNQFCTSDLSALYVDITKDRMYCDAATSIRRKSTQTVMFHVFSSLCRLLAPILVYTADEAWEHAGYESSVHLQDFPETFSAFAAREASGTIARLQDIKAVIQIAIEEQIKAKTFTKNNEADVLLTVPANESEDVVSLLEDRIFSTEFFIIADLKVSTGENLAATASKTVHAMCPRCRRYEPLGKSGLCDRCAEVMA
ncbi:isoleucine--tRNA ligase [Akkermansia sp. N21116]|jgi:isoleucyl-tRNA synthetase|uniref:isoleucine--tRNA ligase n=1 Tax=Akkermansia sp. N21116 TaxID=3040764 RepID=UPI00244ED977|nr:isoleucine--tRNA ligase [Akkermansia sp. N21116]WPX41512.1 isoleucine--tRNA ligase [Akkermansia sp. N21116]